MRKLMTVGMALALSLAVAGSAQANPVNTTDFDSFNLGSVDGQSGWNATSTTLDQAVVNTGTGNSLRISNAVVASSFADMPYSAPVDLAGEGEANKVLVNEFKVASNSPDLQPGLAMSISPTDGNGNRMSYVRLEDTTAGIKVTFIDTPTGYVDPSRHVSFDAREIATLDRADWHKIRFETTFVPGQDNDIVRVFVDGVQKVCGESWENYYRYDSEQVGGGNTVKPSDRLMWRISGTAAPANNGSGFLFDEVTSESKATGSTSCATPPADGPQGQQGQPGADGRNGTNGVDGVNGTNGAPGANGKDGVSITRTLRGASIRHLQVRKITGMKFLSAKATMGGKRLSVNGRTVTVDLRGKGVGRYRVHTSARYQANGKTFTVNRFRYLRVLIAR